MAFEIIAFDADDTLWHSEVYYREAQLAMADLLAGYGVEPSFALELLHKIEIANLEPFGYGIKGFTLSMVETAIQASSGRVSAADIQAVVDLGRAMTHHEVLLMTHCAETVRHLANSHVLMLVTKGDLMDQERKIAESGLADHFQMIEIVSAKTPQVYSELLRRHHLTAERFLMVGNAMRSDIIPVLNIGGWAVFVPYLHNWEHEAAEPPAHARYFAIEHLGQLPALVGQIEAGF